MGGDSKIFMADFCKKILRKLGLRTQRLQKHLVTTKSLTITSCHVMQLDMFRKPVQPNVKLSFGEGGRRAIIKPPLNKKTNSPGRQATGVFE